MRGEKVSKDQFLDFSYKVGVIAGATISMGIIVSYVSAIQWEKSIRPVFSAITAEARARESGDSLVVSQLQRMQRERLDLLDIMAYPLGSLRDKRIEAVRSRWEKE